MTVCIINTLSALKLADHSCSHVQNGLSFICPCVDRGTNIGYIWGLGGFNLSGHSRGLLGMLNQPAWSRFCTLRTIRDGSPGSQWFASGAGNETSS